MLGSLISRDQTVFQVYVFHIGSLKKFFMLDVIGGLAFFMLGRLIFGSDLLCIICNMFASQMLHYIVPVSSV